MTIVTMMERKECVEIDQAQLFQQFNLQADRDRHDLIFDVVEDIARILGRAEAQYLKTDYDNLRDSLDGIVPLAQKIWIWTSIACCAGCEILRRWQRSCCGVIHISAASSCRGTIAFRDLGHANLFMIGTCSSMFL